MALEMRLEMDPLVSVIVPVYNVLPYLHEALDSLIGQTYRELEIILIDDGSTDGSGDVCDEYAERDQRINVIHQENKGLSAARNVGLDRANGGFIAFLDPDDAFHSEFIEIMLSSMIRENVDIALCKYSIQYTTEKMTWSSTDKKQPLINSGIYDRPTVLDVLVKGNINVSVWNKIYRKDLWNSIRFYEGHVHEDIDNAYSIFSNINKLFVVQDSLYIHRKRPGSITMDYSYRNIDDAFQSVIRTESFINANVPSIFSEKQQLCFQQTLIMNILNCYYRSKKVTGVSKHEYRTKLRQQIIKTGEKYDLSVFCFKVRLAYSMIRKCPLFFDLCYPCYRFLVKIFRKVKIT
jgi:glycosyltransferase involved in cell wall biosynthesis